MKIAIVEDNPSDSSILEELLKRYFLRENILMELKKYTSGEDFFVGWPLEFDIVFLDIQLEKLNGIEIAVKIRETNERAVIIFVTNNSQYSLAGYSVDALDYLVKPISFELIDRVLPRAVRRLDNSDKGCLTLHTNDGYFVVNLVDINYIETENRKMVIHTKTGEITCIRTLQYMEEKLPKTFFRCHSAFLVNLLAVESLRGAYALVAGKMIPISKHRRTEFIRAFTDCIGDKL